MLEMELTTDSAEDWIWVAESTQVALADQLELLRLRNTERSSSAVTRKQEGRSEKLLICIMIS